VNIALRRKADCSGWRTLTEATRSFEVSGSKADFTDNLPPQSITVYSTYKLMHGDPGITGD
jgi:hypothetical protein